MPIKTLDFSVQQGIPDTYGDDLVWKALANFSYEETARRWYAIELREALRLYPDTSPNLRLVQIIPHKILEQS